MFQSSSGKNFTSVVEYIENIFSIIIFRIIFGLALVYFLLNVYALLKDGGDATKRKDHQKAIMWSLIAMAAMFSIWALVALVTGTFGEPAVLPQINKDYLDSF